MEQILENINSTSIGRVLKKIASLPEVRKEKVLGVRQQLTEGKYELNKRLDVALDKVLEDLTTEEELGFICSFPKVLYRMKSLQIANERNSAPAWAISD